MAIIIGSARMGENGSITGGKAGDQKQTATPDYKGEVSMQNFYVHAKGWYVLRPKSVSHAEAIGNNMIALCNNSAYGYNQNTRLDVIKNGIRSKTKGGCDCSSAVRACVKEATGIDPGNFITDNEVSFLEKTGLFQTHFKYTSGTKLYKGDVLVTCRRGHTVIVTESPYKRTTTTTTTQTPASSTSTSSSSNKITVDGEWGKATTRAAQKVFKTSVDGIVSNQIASYKKYMPNCLTSSWQFKSSGYKGGSDLIKAIQKWCGASVDGLCGQATIKALQKKLGVKADGYMGGQTVTAFQKYLNKYL